MEQQPSDPIIVAHERFYQRAARVPDLDAFVPGARGEEFAATAARRGFFESRERGEVRVAGRGGESAAFDDVLVAEERGFHVPRPRVPESSRLVVPRREEPAAVETGGDVAHPVGMAA